VEGVAISGFRTSLGLVSDGRSEVVVERTVGLADRTAFAPVRPPHMKTRSMPFIALLARVLLALSSFLWPVWEIPWIHSLTGKSRGILQTCAALKAPAEPLADFHSRKV